MAVLAEGIYIRGSSLVLQAAPLHGAEGHQHGRLDLRPVRAERGPLLDLDEDSEALGRLERIITAVNDRLRP